MMIQQRWAPAQNRGNIYQKWESCWPVKLQLSSGIALGIFDSRAWAVSPVRHNSLFSWFFQDYFLLILCNPLPLSLLLSLFMLFPIWHLLKLLLNRIRPIKQPRNKRHMTNRSLLHDKQEVHMLYNLTSVTKISFSPREWERCVQLFHLRKAKHISHVRELNFQHLFKSQILTRRVACLLESRISRRFKDYSGSNCKGYLKSEKQDFSRQTANSLKKSVLMSSWLSENCNQDSLVCIKKLHQSKQTPNTSLPTVKPSKTSWLTSEKESNNHKMVTQANQQNILRIMQNIIATKKPELYQNFFSQVKASLPLSALNRRMIQ